jgi:hypothetical protein
MTNKLLVLGGLVGGLALAVGCGDSGSTSGSGGSGTGASGSGGSTSTTTTSSTGGSGTGGSTTTGGAATCTSYCTAIMANCTGADQQYLTQATCEAECAAFAAGMPGDMSGNSLECRAYHAGVAGTMNPEVHCVHAGPLGSGSDAAGAACTTNNIERCQAYCSIVTEVCGTTPYASADACNTACMTATDDTDFTTNVQSGDNLACHMYHVSVAAQGGANATTHCPHADVTNAVCN